MKITIAFTFVLAAPYLTKRRLMCAAVCNNDWENSIAFSEFKPEDIKSFVANCCQGLDYTTAQTKLYLDSVNGSCTKAVYELVEDVLTATSTPVVGACSAVCRDNPVDVSTIAFNECIRELGPSLMPYTLEFLQMQYKLKGNCSFQTSNQIQKTMRNYEQYEQ
jgi:hypothetical protein